MPVLVFKSVVCMKLPYDGNYKRMPIQESVFLLIYCYSLPIQIKLCMHNNPRNQIKIHYVH